MLHLYHLDGCPRGQRIAIALHEKFQPFEETVVDPAAPPAALVDASTEGALPALLHDGRVVTDSTIALEYVDECFPEPPLLPADPWERARARRWIRGIERDFIPTFEALLEGAEGPRAETLRMAFRLEMMRLSSRLEEHGGPFFFNAQFGLVDIALLPWFERYAAVERLARCPIPAEDAFSALRAWADAATDRPAFLETRRDDADWAAFYRQRLSAGSAPLRGGFQVEPGEQRDGPPDLRLVPEPEPLPEPEQPSESEAETAGAPPVLAEPPAEQHSEPEASSEVVSEPELHPVSLPGPASAAPGEASTVAEAEAEEAAPPASEPQDAAPEPTASEPSEPRRSPIPRASWPESWPDTQPRTTPTSFVPPSPSAGGDEDDDDDEDLPPIDPDLAYLDAVSEPERASTSGVEAVEITCRKWPSDEEVFAYFDAIPGVVDIVLDPPERKVLLRFSTDDTSAEIIWGHIEYEPELEPELMT